MSALAGAVARNLICRSSNLLNRNFRKEKLNLLRKGHVWSYRTPPPEASKYVKIGAEVVGAYMWWWILWHLFTEPEHITGEFPYPDPSKWTNEELGIPPDDAE